MKEVSEVKDQTLPTLSNVVLWVCLSVMPDVTSHLWASMLINRLIGLCYFVTVGNDMHITKAFIFSLFMYGFQ